MKRNVLMILTCLLLLNSIHTPAEEASLLPHPAAYIKTIYFKTTQNHKSGDTLSWLQGRNVTRAELKTLLAARGVQNALLPAEEALPKGMSILPNTLMIRIDDLPADMGPLSDEPDEIRENTEQRDELWYIPAALMEKHFTCVSLLLEDANGEVYTFQIDMTVSGPGSVQEADLYNGLWITGQRNGLNGVITAVHSNITLTYSVYLTDSISHFTPMDVMTAILESARPIE